MKRMFLVGLLSATCLATVFACSDDATTDEPSAADSGKDSTSSTTDTGTNQASDSSANDSSTTKDTSATETSVPDAGVDSGLAKACDDYCTCMDAIAPCNAVFKNKGACLTACTTQTKWDLTCRTTHCGLATTAGTKGERTTHCGHAEGVGLCLDKP